MRDSVAMNSVIEKKSIPAHISRTNDVSDQLFVVFTGMAQRLMMDPFVFFSKTKIWEHNLVMLRDPQNCFYHGTFAPTPDFETLKKWLQDHIEKNATHRAVHFVGTSAGGYAAILLGYYLKPDWVTAFGAPTHIDCDAYRKKYQQADSWALPVAHQQLNTLLEKGNGKTRYRLYYCRDYITDRDNAKRLKNCPGVTLYPQEGDRHGVVQEMNKRNLLQNLFFPPELSKPSRSNTFLRRVGEALTGTINKQKSQAVISKEGLKD